LDHGKSNTALRSTMFMRLEVWLPSSRDGRNTENKIRRRGRKRTGRIIELARKTSDNPVAMSTHERVPKQLDLTRIPQ